MNDTKLIKEYFLKLIEESIRYQGILDTEYISLILSNTLSKNCIYDKKKKQIIFKLK